MSNHNQAEDSTPRTFFCFPPFGPSKSVAFLSLGLILATNAFFLWQRAFVGFYHLDWGGFLDTSWRLMHGQRMYEDFFYHTGPVHPLMNLLFFKILGFGKPAILVHLILVSTLVTLATFHVTYKKMPLFFSLVSTLMGMISFYFIYPHPYYDYTAHFWGILAVSVLAAGIPSTTARATFRIALVAGMLTTFSLMTKINVGAPYFAVAFAVSLLNPYRIRTVSGYFLGTVSVLGILFLFVSPAPFFTNVFAYSQSVSARMIRFIFIQAWMKNLFWLPLLVVPLSLLPFGKKIGVHLALFAGLGFIGIFTINTGSYRNWDYMPMMGIYMGLGFRVLFKASAQAQTKIQKIRCSAGIGILLIMLVIQAWGFVSFAVTATVKRYGMGPGGWIHEIPPERRYRLKEGVFRGWVFDQEEGRLLDKIVHYLQTNVPAQDSFLIVSDLQIIYALAGRESYRGVPFHWYPGTLPSWGAQRDRVRQKIMAAPPQWILTYLDNNPYHPINKIFLYLEIPMDFFKHYEVAQAWGTHALLKRVK